MDLTVIALIWGAVATVAALFMWNKASRTAPVEPMSTGKPAPAAAAAPVKSSDASAQLEAKLAEIKGELAQSKERLAARTKEVEDLKEQAKQKARRDGKREQREGADAPKGPDPRDVEIQSLRKGMASLESQLNALKRESASTASSAAELSQKTADEVASAKKVVDGEMQRRRSLEEENAALKKTLDELRNAMKKADARPDIPGTTLNLKELPTAAVQELSRYFRKGEEFERLYTVAQSQLQLEKDRYLELQRRYFAVCRELAVQTGTTGGSDADVQQKAEAVIDAVAERGESNQNQNQGRREPREPRPPREAREPREPREQNQQNQQPKREPEYQLGPDGQPLLGPDGQPLRKPRYVLGPDGQPVLGPDGQPLIKKRRRRRRRKIAGEPSVEAAGDEGGDDEGDDDGDDAGDAPKSDGGDSGAQAPA